MEMSKCTGNDLEPKRDKKVKLFSRVGVVGKRNLVFFSFLAFSLQGVHTDFLVILLKSSQILTGLREFTLFHALSNIPMDKSTLGVHQVKLVIQTGPGLSNGSGVRQHADCTLDLC